MMQQWIKTSKDLEYLKYDKSENENGKTKSKNNKTAVEKPIEDDTTAIDRKLLRRVLHLEHGSLPVMEPPTNDNWYHGLPKRSVSRCPNPRINLTFRKMKV